MRIYTRTGDDGTTALIGGQRLSKADPRVEAYGTVDELSALLGVVSAAHVADRLHALLGPIQEDLFCLGAELATPAVSAQVSGARLPLGRTMEIEQLIDDLDGELPELRRFILPGGSHAAALLHLARTVARRAERRVIAVASQGGVRPETTQYLNRLSDLLFVMARWQNRADGVQETEWVARDQEQLGPGEEGTDDDTH